jgi:hypothetical protein
LNILQLLEEAKAKSISLTNTKKRGDGDENLPIINETKALNKRGREKGYKMEGRTQVLGGLMSFFSGVKGKRTQFMFSSQHPSPPKG